MTQEYWTKLDKHTYERDGWQVYYQNGGHGMNYKPDSDRPWAIYRNRWDAVTNSKGRIRVFGSADAAMAAAEKLMQTDEAVLVMGKACSED